MFYTDRAWVFVKLPESLVFLVIPFLIIYIIYLLSLSIRNDLSGNPYYPPFFKLIMLKTSQKSLVVCFGIKVTFIFIKSGNDENKN